MSGKLGMKRKVLSLYCRRGHRRCSENIQIRLDGEIRCKLCERIGKKRCRYGLEDEQWKSVFESQGRCCAVCKSSTTKTSSWHTDHSHRTNRFRGILCDACNRALGSVKDSIPVLKQLIEYLQRTEYGISDIHDCE